MCKEIELKFSISKMPNLGKSKNIKIYKILQNYIYQDNFTTIRKRKIVNVVNKDCEYVYTVKTRGDIKNKNAVYEIESKISENDYNSFNHELNTCVDKCRLKIPIENNLIAEVDLYYGNLEGLITVEVEFENEEQIEKFEKPEWFGEELDKKVFSNANLSKMSKEEFLNIININILNNNMVIKNKIEKLYNLYDNVKK